MTALALAAALEAAGASAPRARVAAAAIVAEARDLDPRLLGAIALRESSLRPHVVGARGEIGLMQVLPATAQRWCGSLLPRLTEPRINVRCAVRILRRARVRCGDDPARMLAAYNGSRSCNPGRYSRRVLGMMDGRQG